MITEKNRLEALEQSIAALEAELQQWWKTLGFACSLFLLFFFVLSRTPLFGVSALVGIVGLGIFAVQGLQLRNKHQQFVKDLASLKARPEGQLSLQILQVQDAIQRFQQKLKDYELSLREGRSHLTRLKDTLEGDRLYDNRRKKLLTLKQQLEKNLSCKQLIMDFYQEAKNRYEKDLYNLQEDLHSLQLASYLQQENMVHLNEELPLYSTSFSLANLKELERIEAHLPQIQAEVLDVSLETQLKEMITKLRAEEDELEAGDSGTIAMA